MSSVLENPPQVTTEDEAQANVETTKPADSSTEVHFPHSRIEQQIDRQTMGYDPNKHETLVIAAQSGQLDPDVAAEVLRRESLSKIEELESSYDLREESLPEIE